jgi:preprotein translocase subunit SecG
VSLDSPSGGAVVVKRNRRQTASVAVSPAKSASLAVPLFYNLSFIVAGRRPVEKDSAVNVAFPTLWAANVWQEWAPPILAPVLIILGIFLIFLVLIQSGKGGGLAGAFGGVGGSSPFGSKAGDTFTRVTIYVAAVWILLIMVQVRVMNAKSGDGVVLPGAVSTK